MAKEIDADSELFFIQPYCKQTQIGDKWYNFGLAKYEEVNYKKRFLAQRKKKLSITVRTETDND